MSYSTAEFEGIYTRCFPASMRLAAGMLHDDDEARDVVQETFIRLWESDMEIKNPEAYILRAVRNTCINRIRATDTRERMKMGYSLEPATDDPDYEQRAEEVRKAVATLLTPRERQVVDCVFSDGMSYKDTAQSLEVSVALVNKCIVRALKTLRTRFNTSKA